MPESARRHAWGLLPAILLAIFMSQFDLYVVNVALPVLQRQFGAGEAALQLIVGGYAFVYASGMITAGRLGDILGHRVMFVGGMVAFGLASLWCGTANSPGELVAARLVQGLSAAAMVPQAFALIAVLFEPSERPRALSFFGVTIGVGAVAGQVLGGVILNANLLGWGWRPIFLVNVPLALAGAIIGLRLPGSRPSGTRPRLDVPGAAGISAGLALILVPLTLGREDGWPAWTWASFACAVVILAGALWWEARLARAAAEPVIDLTLFRERVFSLGLGAGIAIFASFFSFVFTLTLLLQDGYGLSPLRAGLSFGPLGIAFAAASLRSRGLAVRYGARVIVVGTCIALLGLAGAVILLAASGGRPSLAALLAAMAVVGAGNGTAVPLLVGVVMQHMTRGAGAVSGIMTTANQFAAAAGVAAIGAQFFAVLGAGAGLRAYAHAATWSTVTSLALAIVPVLLTWRLSRAPAKAATEAEPAPQLAGRRSGEA